MKDHKETERYDDLSDDEIAELAEEIVALDWSAFKSIEVELG
jgi:hypothetical protein